MKSQKIYLSPYDWNLTVFYDTVAEDCDSIIESLEEIGCDRRTLCRAEENLRSGARNTGLTFSNQEERESIVVLSEASSEAEFANTWFHEVFHVVIHIASVDGFDYQGEHVAYICGYIAMRMQPYASHFICKNCHCHEI